MKYWHQQNQQKITTHNCLRQENILIDFYYALHFKYKEFIFTLIESLKAVSFLKFSLCEVANLFN